MWPRKASTQCAFACCALTPEFDSQGGHLFAFLVLAEKSVRASHFGAKAGNGAEKILRGNSKLIKRITTTYQLISDGIVVGNVMHVVFFIDPAGFDELWQHCLRSSR